MKNYKTESISKNSLSKHNKSCILHTVWEHKGISRLEIAQITGLSTATVSRLVESLMNEDHLLEERQSIPISRGRPMKSLYFGNNQRFIIGIDLGTTFIRGILTNMNAEPIKETEVVTESDKEPEYVMNKVVEVIERLTNTNLINPDQIIGVGIAVAGIVNLKEGLVVYSPAFHWRNVEFRKFIQSRVKVPVFFDNVSRVMALGELAFGVGNQYNNMVCINVGYGIGAGIIINKAIFYGTEGMAGEFGHVPVEGDQLIQCPCGKRTCLTAYSSGDAIAQRARLKLKEQPSDLLMDLCHHDLQYLTAKMVIEAARENDPIASEVFRKSLHYLGTSIAGMIDIFNPEVVFIGGGVSMNGNIFWEPLSQIIHDNVFNRDLRKFKLMPVTFQDRAALYGAIGLVINEVLNMDI